MDGETTPLQCAVDAVLQRNALIVTTLDGLAKLRAGAPPSDAERVLFTELRENIVAVAQLVPPRLLMPQAQPPMQTFMATSRAMGLLPLPGDFPSPSEPPPEEPAAAAADEQQQGEQQRATRAVRRLAPGERAKLRRRMPAAPRGFTGGAFHKLPSSLEGVEFFEEAVVLDLDEAGNATRAPFTFSLREPGHGISFAIGEGDDGSPLLSYSICHAFYQLSDGSKWAEHTDLYDVDDLRTAGKAAKLPYKQCAEGLRERELLAGTARRHTNLDFAEYDFHAFSKLEFDRRDMSGNLPDEAYFVRTQFEPTSMRILGPWTLPPPLAV